MQSAVPVVGPLAVGPEREAVLAKAAVGAAAHTALAVPVRLARCPALIGEGLAGGPARTPWALVLPRLPRPSLPPSQTAVVDGDEVTASCTRNMFSALDRLVASSPLSVWQVYCASAAVPARRETSSSAPAAPGGRKAWAARIVRARRHAAAPRHRRPRPPPRRHGRPLLRGLPPAPPLRPRPPSRCRRPPLPPRRCRGVNRLPGGAAAALARAGLAPWAVPATPLNRAGACRACDAAPHPAHPPAPPRAPKCRRSTHHRTGRARSCPRNSREGWRQRLRATPETTTPGTRIHYTPRPPSRSPPRPPQVDQSAGEPR